MPVCLAQRRGVIRAAVVKGDAPLLPSRPAMKKLGAEMDFVKDELRLFNGEQAVPMSLNSAGQYMVAVTQFEKSVSETEHSPEASFVLGVEPATVADDPVPPALPEPHAVIGKKGKSKDYWIIDQANHQIIRNMFVPAQRGSLPVTRNVPSLQLS